MPGGGDGGGVTNGMPYEDRRSPGSSSRSSTGSSGSGLRSSQENQETRHTRLSLLLTDRFQRCPNHNHMSSMIRDVGHGTWPKS